MLLRLAGDVFIPRGVDVNALDHDRAFEFNPTNVKVRRVLLPAKQSPSELLQRLMRVSTLLDTSAGRLPHHIRATGATGGFTVTRGCCTVAMLGRSQCRVNLCQQRAVRPQD